MPFKYLASPLIVIAIALAFTTTGDAQGPPDRVIIVNCAQGDSVNAALSQRAARLTIEIRGICDEDVEVRRDWVTLRGADPNTDGLRGVGPGDKTGDGVLLIREARNVVIENLLVTSGARNGISAVNAGQVNVNNCQVRDSGNFGILSQNGVVFVADTTMTNNVAAGLGGFGSIVLTCVGCTITGSSTAAVAINNAFMTINNSTVSGRVLALDGGSRILVLGGSTISAPASGIALQTDMGEIRASDSTITGRIIAVNKSLILLNNVTQSASTLNNQVDVSSTVRASGTTTLAGNLTVSRFSTFLLENTSTLGGNLSCSAGGNAFCSNPAAVGGTTTACGLCVKP